MPNLGESELGTQPPRRLPVCNAIVETIALQTEIHQAKEHHMDLLMVTRQRQSRLPQVRCVCASQRQSLPDDSRSEARLLLTLPFDRGN
jgi:hypothetical protein